MTMQDQLESQWCWAAVTVSVLNYFDPVSQKSQCEIAREVLGEAAGDCCNNPSACNTPQRLQAALRHIGKLDDLRAGHLEPADLQTQLNKGLPVGVRIGWSGGGGHFVVIDGAGGTDDSLQVHVIDPLFGNSTWDYEEFRSFYQGAGEWTDTFLLKP